MATDVKTLPHDGDVQAFIDAVPHPVRRRDAQTLLDLMGQITGEPPVMWGPSIVGFGTYHYHYASGRQGEASGAGFSPRKAASTIYLPDGVGTYADLLTRLGPHTSSVSCLYIKDLEKVDLAVLEEIIRRSYTTVTSGTFGARASQGAHTAGDDHPSPQDLRSDPGQGTHGVENVKIMNDYSVSWPLWNRFGPAERHELPLSEELALRLERWARTFNDHFDPETGWDDPALKEAHATEAHTLHALVSAELGPDYTVQLDLWEA